MNILQMNIKNDANKYYFIGSNTNSYLFGTMTDGLETEPTVDYRDWSTLSTGAPVSIGQQLRT